MQEEKAVKPFKKEGLSISTSEKMGLVSNLNTMLSAGIPIMEVITSLLEDSKGNQKKILLAMKDDLSQGQHLYYTFSRYPRIFDNVTVSIIKAAEEAGTLDQALKDMKANILKDREFNDKVKGAMIYPAFIMGVFVMVLIVMLVVVVPKISTVFSRLNVPLPLPTKIMMYLSDLLMTKTLTVVSITAIIVGSFVYLFRRYKSFFINALTSLPLISQLARQIDLARFARSFYLLLESGIPITSALQLTADVVVKREIHDAIIHARAMVVAGKKLSEGLKENKKILPTIMIKIIEAGEKSGTLGNCMEEVSEFLDYEVSNTLKTLIATIEPIMLILVGVLVGGMMISILAPMYGLISQVGAGAGK